MPPTSGSDPIIPVTPEPITPSQPGWLFIGPILVVVLAVGAYQLYQVPGVAPVTDSSARAVSVHEDGSELYVSIDAVTGAESTIRTITDAESLLKSRFAYTLPDGTVVTTDKTGIVHDGTTLVVSVVPPRDRTPIAVSQSGDLVAWVATSDRSLQVFKQSGEHYVPIHLVQKSPAESLAFSADGAYLLTTMTNDVGATEVWSTDLVTKSTTLLTTTSNFIIFTNGYE